MENVTFKPSYNLVIKLNFRIRINGKKANLIMKHDLLTTMRSVRESQDSMVIEPLDIGLHNKHLSVIYLIQRNTVLQTI